jgi:light-regulated signal transduction histidine kinase (bacteriophytochrome)
MDHKSASLEDLEQTIQLLQQELAATNHEILLLNLELEKRVDERTAALEAANRRLAIANHQLQMANRELEAFSYSISHDLRAPLRAIGAFSNVLLADFGPQLPPEARQHLKVIVTSADRMKQMIEDLLRFSHLSRQPLRRQSVDLAALAHQVLDDLGGERTGRNVEVQVQKLPGCTGDPSLLRHVFVNLLSNALKFTRQKPKATIEVGYRDQDGETTYFVRDNGAGFDMTYAKKLFGAFQRMHSASEFEGTGVGLATVQRIVQRHGGRIWAEAEVGQGATFRFTLRR